MCRAELIRLTVTYLTWINAITLRQFAWNMIWMKTAGVLILILKMVSAKFCDCYCEKMNRPIGRIVGGSRASQGEFPWMVSITDGDKFCGGALISRDYVLTAAHCAVDFSESKPQVILGATDITDDGYAVAIKRFILHEDYDGLNSDIALVQLAQKVTFQKWRVAPACLPEEDVLNAMDKVTISGWGQQCFQGAMSPQLMKVTVRILDNHWCGQTYHMNLTKSTICAGLPKGGKDACQGDSGGPLHAQNGQYVDVVGIVSWGEQCAQPKKPGIYTRVIHYTEWIDKNSGNSCICNKHMQRIMHILEY